MDQVHDRYGIAGHVPSYAPARAAAAACTTVLLAPLLCRDNIIWAALIGLARVLRSPPSKEPGLETRGLADWMWVAVGGNGGERQTRPDAIALRSPGNAEA